MFANTGPIRYLFGVKFNRNCFAVYTITTCTDRRFTLIFLQCIRRIARIEYPKHPPYKKVCLNTHMVPYTIQSLWGTKTTSLLLFISPANNKLVPPILRCFTLFPCRQWIFSFHERRKVYMRTIGSHQSRRCWLWHSRGSLGRMWAWREFQTIVIVTCDGVRLFSLCASRRHFITWVAAFSWVRDRWFRKRMFLKFRWLEMRRFSAWRFTANFISRMFTWRWGFSVFWRQKKKVQEIRKSIISDQKTCQICTFLECKL